MATVRGGSDYSQSLATGSVGPVAPTVETTIATYTAVGIKRLTRISCSGDVRALWRVYVDASVVDVKRGDGRNEEFVWEWPLKVDSGSIVEVKVTHYKITETPTFDASIFGR